MYAGRTMQDPQSSMLEASRLRPLQGCCNTVSRPASPLMQGRSSTKYACSAAKGKLALMRACARLRQQPLNQAVRGCAQPAMHIVVAQDAEAAPLHPLPGQLGVPERARRCCRYALFCCRATPPGRSTQQPQQPANASRPSELFCLWLKRNMLCT